MTIQKLSLQQIRKLCKTRMVEDFLPDELKPLATMIIEGVFDAVALVVRMRKKA